MLDLRLAGFGPLSDMGVRTSAPQVHVWLQLQPLSARAQSAPRSTRSTTWQAQRGLRSSSASEGRPRLRAVSGPAGTACHGDSHQPGHCGRDGGKLRIDTEADRPSESPAGFKAPLRQDHLSASSLVQAQSLNIGPRGGLGFGSAPKRSGRDRFR